MTTKITYQVVKHTGNEFRGTDGNWYDEIENTCGHNHKSHEAAEKCYNKLLNHKNGTCSAYWYNRVVIEKMFDCEPNPRRLANVSPADMFV